jgi:hypothetical protein
MLPFGAAFWLLVRSALPFLSIPAARVMLFGDDSPCGWKPETGLLKRMNSAFMGHPLSRKNVAEKGEEGESARENVSGRDSK